MQEQPLQEQQLDQPIAAPDIALVVIGNDRSATNTMHSSVPLHHRHTIVTSLHMSSSFVAGIMELKSCSQERALEFVLEHLNPVSVNLLENKPSTIAASARHKMARRSAARSVRQFVCMLLCVFQNIFLFRYFSFFIFCTD